jgi:hypothetical protein
MGVAFVSDCSPPTPIVFIVPPDLRSCPGVARVPAPLPPVVTSERLRLGYDAMRLARMQDQGAATVCGRRLAAVIDLVDAFNIQHSH